MDEKEIIISTARDLLIAAMNNKINIIDRSANPAVNQIGDLFITMVEKVKSAYDKISIKN